MAGNSTAFFHRRQNMALSEIREECYHTEFLFWSMAWYGFQCLLNVSGTGATSAQHFGGKEGKRKERNYMVSPKPELHGCFKKPLLTWESVNSALHWILSEEIETEKQGFHQKNLGTVMAGRWNGGFTNALVLQWNSHGSWWSIVGTGICFLSMHSKKQTVTFSFHKI